MTVTKRDVELTGISGVKDTPMAVASATAVPTATLLDPQTVAVLSNLDSFFIQQRIRILQTATVGFVKQPNVYDVFDHETNKRIMVSDVM